MKKSMRKNIVKLLSVLLLMVLVICTIPTKAEAAGYPSDYRYWSQGASTDTNMANYGCWVVAQAKLLYECNIDRRSTFNPDTYKTWQQNNGYLNSGFYQTNGGAAPVVYANLLGKSLFYLGKTTTSVEEKVWNNISKGYKSIVYVTTSSGGSHYVMIDNNNSAANGVLWCYNSYVNSASAAPSSIASRKYRSINAVYTYSTSASVSVEHGYPGYNDEITDTNAIVYGTVTKPASYTVTNFGIRIRKTNDTYANGKTYIHASSSNYSGTSQMRIWFNINDELNLTLTHATSYTYQLYAKINGTEYWSSEKSFTTTGTHSYGNWTTTKAATCTAAGSKKGTCACGATQIQSIAALGHNYATTWTVDKAATCTAAGSKSRHCTRCSATTDVTAIPAGGHSYGGWTTTKAPTCTAVGSQQRKCGACGGTETQSIAVLGHNYATTWTVDKAATCTAAGSKSHHCTRCTAYTDITNIPALGHNWQAWVIEVEATATQAGTEARSCLACASKETKTIPKLSEDGHTHVFGEWQTVLAPTCEAKGAAERACTNCGAKETMELAAVEHIFSDWVVISEATNEAEGVKERQCQCCGGVDTLTIPALGNDSESTVGTTPSLPTAEELPPASTPGDLVTVIGTVQKVIPIVFGVICVFAAMVVVIILLVIRKKRREKL